MNVIRPRLSGRSSGGLLAVAIFVAVAVVVLIAVSLPPDSSDFQATVPGAGDSSSSASAGIPQADCFFCAYQNNNCAVLTDPNVPVVLGRPDTRCGIVAPRAGAWDPVLARTHQGVAPLDCNWYGGACRNRFQAACEREFARAPQLVNKKAMGPAYSYPNTVNLAQCTSVKEIYWGHGAVTDGLVPYSRAIALLAGAPIATFIHIVDTSCRVAADATLVERGNTNLQRALDQRRGARAVVEANPLVSTETCQPRDVNCLACGDEGTRTYTPCSELNSCYASDTNAIQNQSTRCSMPDGTVAYRKCCNLGGGTNWRWEPTLSMTAACPTAPRCLSGIDRCNAGDQPSACTNSRGGETTQRCCQTSPERYYWSTAESCPALPQCLAGDFCTEANANAGERWCKNNGADVYESCCPVREGVEQRKWVDGSRCPDLLPMWCTSDACPLSGNDVTRRCQERDNVITQYCARNVSTGNRVWQNAPTPACLPPMAQRPLPVCVPTADLDETTPQACTLSNQRDGWKFCCPDGTLNASRQPVYRLEFPDGGNRANFRCPVQLPECGDTCTDTSGYRACRDETGRARAEVCCTVRDAGMARDYGTRVPEQYGAAFSCEGARAPLCPRVGSSCPPNASQLFCDASGAQAYPYLRPQDRQELSCCAVSRVNTVTNYQWVRGGNCPNTEVRDNRDSRYSATASNYWSGCAAAETAASSSAAAQLPAIQQQCRDLDGTPQTPVCTPTIVNPGGRFAACEVRMDCVMICLNARRP